MTDKPSAKGAKSITKANIAGSELEGIISIEAPEVLDEVVGGSPYGPPNAPPPPPPPPPSPPWTYPGEPPIPSSPAYGPFPSAPQQVG